ncbi:MAG: hypothetical protein GY940_35275 [bacterium]|nr:hypothetical protein [bacterium]
MTVNTISEEISQETETGILAGIKTIWDLLPFLLLLTADARRSMSRLSRSKVDFVDQSRLHAINHPQYVQPFINIDEFSKDVDLKDALRRIFLELDSLHRHVKDTLLIAETEAYTTARLFYKSVKSAAKEGEADAEVIAKDLSYHYKKSRTPKPETNGDDNPPKDEK